MLDSAIFDAVHDQEIRLARSKVVSRRDEEGGGGGGGGGEGMRRRRRRRRSDFLMLVHDSEIRDW